MDYLSNETMLRMLEKVQKQQIEILRTGRSCHIDAGVHRNDFSDTGEHVGFGVTVFEETSLVRDFDFHYSMSQGELNAEYACLEAYVDRIKKEA